MKKYEPTVKSRQLRPITEDEKNILHEIYTSDLVDELKTRCGVDVAEIPPYTKVNFSVEGSALLLKVID